MNKKNWLIAGLSLVMAAGLGVGISACGEKTPDTPEHTHTYDAWDHDDTQHWKYCDEHGTDKSNIDETTKANHDFSNGDCVCGMKKPGGQQGDDTAELDTREFYVVGGGMGDLKSGTWTGPNEAFKFTKATEKDADGFTVYTYQMKLYSADEFKFIEKNTISTQADADGNYPWDETTTFKLADLDLTGLTDPFSGNDNIVVNTGADGIYKFTIRTTKNGAAKQNKVKVELVEAIPPLDVAAQYEMYLVGKIASKPTSDWPSMLGVPSVPTKCYKMELQEDGETFAIEVKLATGDAFKVWNYKLNNKDAGYYPTGVGGDLKVTADGWYVVSWKIGASNVTITPHAHKYTEWGKSTTEHWKVCPLDQAIDESTREPHDFKNGNTCECGYEQATDPDWNINEDGSFAEYTGSLVNITIPANLKIFPHLGAIFGNFNINDDFLPNSLKWKAVKSVTVAPGSTTFKMENGALLSMDGKTLYAYFYYNTATEVTFESVETVAPGAFFCNETLETVNLPNVITLEEDSFNKMTQLRNVSFPKLEVVKSGGFSAIDKVETLELPSARELANLSKLTSLVSAVIGDKLETWNGEGFNGCSKLESVTIKATTPPALPGVTSARRLFYACPNIKNIHVPEESVEAYKAATGWSYYATKISAITEAVSVAPAEVAMLPEKKD